MREYFSEVGRLRTITIKEKQRTVRVKQKVLCDGECSQHRCQQGADPVENFDQTCFFDAACSGPLNEVIEPET